MADFTETTLPFRVVEKGVGIGNNPPEGWRPIRHFPLTVFTGLTGVGKTTTINTLRQIAGNMTMLPDRRTLTDKMIIPLMIGEKPPETLDRSQRFACTRRFRDLWPGGMGVILTGLHINPDEISGRLVFDGLRGKNEIRHASEHLPLANFVFLYAPDEVRLKRLLGRNDSFDRISNVGNRPETVSGGIFDGNKKRALIDWANENQIPLENLDEKIRIVTKESLNYNEHEMTRVLNDLVPDGRKCVLDTSLSSPDQLAETIVNRLRLQEMDEGHAVKTVFNC